MPQGVAMVAAVVLLQAAPAAAQIYEGRQIVAARLIADTLRVQPGVSFTAAVHLTIQPGWHVYWQNPGDTALPVAVAWEASDAAVSSTQWPSPSTYREGTLTVFGYEREVMLLTSSTPTAASGARGVTLRASVEWLVCQTVCLPGEANLTLSLPGGVPGASPDASAIRRFEAAVPRAVGAPGVRGSARKSGDRWIVMLEFEGRDRILAFYPRRMAGLTIAHGAIRVNGSLVEFPTDSDDANTRPTALTGVVVTDGGSFEVAAPLRTEGGR